MNDNFRSRIIEALGKPVEGASDDDVVAYVRTMREALEQLAKGVVEQHPNVGDAAALLLRDAP